MISDHADPLAKIGSKESGGQNIYVMNIARLLAELGHQVDVYTRWDQASKQEVVAVHKGLRVIRVHAGPKAYMPRDDFLNVVPAFTASIEQRIAAESLVYDIIFSNYWFSGIIGLQLAEKHRWPQVHLYHSIGQVRFETLKDITPRSIDDNLFKIRKEWERRIAEASTGILTTSPVERTYIHRLFNIDPARIACIPIGVDLKLFKPRSAKSLRQRLHLPMDKTVILYVGRLELRKGVATLIKALKDVPEGDLYIVGGGKKQDRAEGARLQRIASSLGLSDRVHFLGPKSQAQVALYYAAADVCAVPSYYEPFGIVPIEAMASGTPVVASKTGGIQFTVVEDVTGHLVKPRDHRALAAKINQVLSHGKAAYSKATRKYIEQYFSWPAIAKETAEYFSSLTLKKWQSSYDESAEQADQVLSVAKGVAKDIPADTDDIDIEATARG